MYMLHRRLENGARVRKEVPPLSDGTVVDASVIQLPSLSVTSEVRRVGHPRVPQHHTRVDCIVVACCIHITLAYCGLVHQIATETLTEKTYIVAECAFNSNSSDRCHDQQTRVISFPPCLLRKSSFHVPHTLTVVIDVLFGVHLTCIIRHMSDSQ
jgi:hypothetical protein